MKTLKKNNISKGSSINSPVTVNKNCDLPPFFNPDYFAHVVVQTIEELNSIPCKLRQDGMVATVVQEDYSDYQLQTSRTGFGICDNNAWVKISIGDEVFNGGNLFLFQTEEQANEFMGSTQSKEGQIIYISDLDRYFKFDGQDGLTDAFPDVTKEQIGLENVDNTSDLNKPISTTTQIELDKKVNKPTLNNTPDYVLLADGSTAPKSDFGKVNSVNGINPDNNKNIKVGINEILKEYQPNIVADKNKKVLLFDEDGKTYYFSLGNIITNTSVDESLFVNVDNLLGVNTTSAITEKVINNFENITYPIDISLDYNYTEISDIFINSCLKLPRDYYYIISNNRIKIKDFSDLINTENWEKLFIEITGTKNINYEQ